MSSSSSFHRSLSTLGVAYLAVLFTVLLFCYLCRRLATSADNPDLITPDGPSPTPGTGSHPHIIFLPEGGTAEASARRSSTAHGLDPAAIDSYPKFPFAPSSKPGGGGGGSGGRDAACPICLCEYREGEMLRVMPGCLHGFHLACVDAWLRLNASCPVCRTSPVPTPPSTPLSELVPLSHFAADRRSR